MKTAKTPTKIIRLQDLKGKQSRKICEQDRKCKTRTTTTTAPTKYKQNKKHNKEIISRCCCYCCCCNEQETFSTSEIETNEIPNKRATQKSC